MPNTGSDTTNIDYYRQGIELREYDRLRVSRLILGPDSADVTINATSFGQGITFPSGSYDDTRTPIIGSSYLFSDQNMVQSKRSLNKILLDRNGAFDILDVRTKILNSTSRVIMSGTLGGKIAARGMSGDAGHGSATSVAGTALITNTVERKTVEGYPSFSDRSNFKMGDAVLGSINKIVNVSFSLTSSRDVHFSDIVVMKRYDTSATGSIGSSLTGDDIKTALSVMTSSVRDDLNHNLGSKVFAGTGLIYGNDTFGTDSIAFGGFKS